VLAPSLELRGPGFLRTGDGRAPQEAHNKAALDLASSLDPLPTYWARLEQHFFELLENLPKNSDTASNTWRKQVKDEAKRALEESTTLLGSTARAIQAVARVGIDFTDYDLKPRPQDAAGTKRTRKGGKRK